MTPQTANWNEIRNLLREAQACLPQSNGGQTLSPVPAGPLTGTLEEYEEFLDANELELAWDALAAVAARLQAPAPCWLRLARAASVMGLLAKEAEAFERASPAVLPDQALAIARQDAEKAYGTLLMYRVTVSLELDGWHVDYELKNPQLNGGGPHYVIDAGNGMVLSKRYEQ